MTDTDSQARKRERQEPEELHNPVPKPLAMLAVGLVAWGVWYYFQNVGFPADAGDRRSVIIIDPAASIDGAVVYAGNCVACITNTTSALSDQQACLSCASSTAAGDPAACVECFE